MRWLDHFTSLVTLISLFVLGPAFGGAIRKNWQPFGIELPPALSTMVAVSLLVGLYGVAWSIRPRSIEWYAWLDQLPIMGHVNVEGSVAVETQ